MQHTQNPGHEETKGPRLIGAASGAQSPGKLGLCRVWSIDPRETQQVSAR